MLPFRLTNRPATYQQYINDVLFDYLDEFCTAYLDDIIVFSEDLRDYKGHVYKVLLRLREAGLQADIKKCKFRVSRTKFLGYILTIDRISPDPDKVSVIKDQKPLKTVKGV